VRRYEQAAPASWTERILMVADKPDAAGDFTRGSQALTEQVPPPYWAERLHAQEIDYAAVKSRLLAGWNQGAWLVNYIGHGGNVGLKNVLRTTDVASLQNGERLPLFAPMTCSVGNFDYPGVISLGERLVLHPKGGAIAAWSPTGMSLDAEAARLNQGMFDALFQDNERVVGEVVYEAQQAYGAEPGNMRYMQEMYGILGDPAVRLH